MPCIWDYLWVYNFCRNSSSHAAVLGWVQLCSHPWVQLAINKFHHYSCYTRVSVFLPQTMIPTSLFAIYYIEGWLPKHWWPFIFKGEWNSSIFGYTAYDLVNMEVYCFHTICYPACINLCIHYKRKVSVIALLL